jgi:hypothetical protein
MLNQAFAVVSSGPCAEVISERERQQGERQMREIKERLMWERLERYRKEMVCREQKLKAREPYMHPGQVQI